MGSAYALTPDDITRLAGLACKLGEDMRCSTTEAVDHLEKLISDGPPPRRRRTVVEFADQSRKLRIRRNETLGVDVFRDPAWDMLLDLLVARAERREVCVSSLCYASGVPLSTALRNLDRLVEQGVVRRIPDPRDHRRCHIEVTDDAAVRLTEIVTQMQECA
jgi:DNA-binding MarR family transcriptional regulator